MEELKNLLAEHEAASYPSGHYGKTINNTNLTMMNSDIVSSAVACIDTAGNLGINFRKMLAKHKEGFPDILAELEDEGLEYFTRARQICDMALRIAEENAEKNK